MINLHTHLQVAHVRETRLGIDSSLEEITAGRRDRFSLGPSRECRFSRYRLHLGTRCRFGLLFLLAPRNVFPFELVQDCESIC